MSRIHYFSEANSFDLSNSPVVELNLMGYANSSQIGSGLRQRLYSRSFIVGDPTNPADRFVYMVLDTQSGDTAIRNGILEGVHALGSDYVHYGTSNIAVTGTHNHNGPVSHGNPPSHSKVNQLRALTYIVRELG